MWVIANLINDTPEEIYDHIWANAYREVMKARVDYYKKIDKLKSWTEVNDGLQTFGRKVMKNINIKWKQGKPEISRKKDISANSWKWWRNNSFDPQIMEVKSKKLFINNQTTMSENKPFKWSMILIYDTNDIYDIWYTY